MHETMKVLEAIGQLKIQEDRIDKALKDLDIVAANRVSAKKVNGISKEDFDKNARASYDSVMALLRRYMALKEAINQFNAATTITVCGQEMTVASALYQKEWGIAQRKRVLTTLTALLSHAEERVLFENGDKLDVAAERNAKQNFEGDPKSDVKDYLKFLEDYKDAHMYELIDPLKIREKIDKMSKEISDFEASVDTQIQIANATTDITIEY
jgi:hypothetical protein